MTTPTRIRVALIGLSAGAVTSWAAEAHLPYLLSPRGLARFQIVALCNSSVAAANAAIAHFKLDPSTVRAHGDPESLAADANVDLVHFAIIAPSVRVGKGVFSEWPLAENAGRAETLVELAKEGGGKTVIGLQGNWAPLAKRIRSLLEEGRIGRILSVERKYGGSSFTIGFGHLFDVVQSVVGEVGALRGHLHIQYPNVPLRNPVTGGVVKTDVPDLILATGMLPDSPLVQTGGAPLFVRFRRGPPFKGEPAVRWTIAGEKGEIRLVSPDTAYLNLGSEGAPIVIEVHDHATDSVSKVDWAWADWQEKLPVKARNVGAMYEAVADGKWFPTFEHALRRHKQLDGMLAELKQ
ncbi:hypothetical protein C8R46DRAFT_1041888 [Mycena filopes]|nr:hypothetical protein C8R46DRAFT_1041888 [Mycena filopes]